MLNKFEPLKKLDKRFNPLFRKGGASVVTLSQIAAQCGLLHYSSPIATSLTDAREIGPSITAQMIPGTGTRYLPIEGFNGPMLDTNYNIISEYLMDDVAGINGLYGYDKTSSDRFYMSVQDGYLCYGIYEGSGFGTTLITSGQFIQHRLEVRDKTITGYVNDVLDYQAVSPTRVVSDKAIQLLSHGELDYRSSNDVAKFRIENLDSGVNYELLICATADNKYIFAGDDGSLYKVGDYNVPGTKTIDAPITSLEDLYGYTIADGSTMYYDAAGTDLIPSGKIIANYPSGYSPVFVGGVHPLGTYKGSIERTWEGVDQLSGDNRERVESKGYNATDSIGVIELGETYEAQHLDLTVEWYCADVLYNNALAYTRFFTAVGTDHGFFAKRLTSELSVKLPTSNDDNRPTLSESALNIPGYNVMRVTYDGANCVLDINGVTNSVAKTGNLSSAGLEIQIGSEGNYAIEDGLILGAKIVRSDASTLELDIINGTDDHVYRTIDSNGDIKPVKPDLNYRGYDSAIAITTEDIILTDATDYDKYGYAINTPQGANLTDEDTNWRTVWLDTSLGDVVKTSGVAQSIIVPCDPSTEYSIQCVGAVRMRVGSFDHYPVVGSVALNATAFSDGVQSATFTTHANAKFLMYYLTNTATKPSSVMITKTATPQTHAAFIPKYWYDEAKTIPYPPYAKVPCGADGLTQGYSATGKTAGDVTGKLAYSAYKVGASFKLDDAFVDIFNADTTNILYDTSVVPKTIDLSASATWVNDQLYVNFALGIVAFASESLSAENKTALENFVTQ